MPECIRRLPSDQHQAESADVHAYLEHRRGQHVLDRPAVQQGGQDPWLTGSPSISELVEIAFFRIDPLCSGLNPISSRLRVALISADDIREVNS
jgi:hypothetical protein